MLGAPAKTCASIKVCILEPGSQDEEIKCSLQKLDLRAPASNRVDYEALSYAWGNPEDVFPITVNTKQAFVTTNLHAALVHLRDPIAGRRLWIDASCINQADLEERRDQVKLMGDIYASATRTLVWLGEEAEEDCRALSIIREVVEPKLEPLSKIGVVPNQRGDYRPTELIIESGDLCTADVGQICVLLTRPWFDRVWVIQEVVNAPAVVVICGRESVTWTWLVCAAGSLVSPFRADMLENLKKLGDRVVSGLMNVASIHIARFCGRLKPFDALKVSQTFTSSDPRDRIFAMLSLMETNGDFRLFEPDYTATYEEILERHSRYFLEVLGQLDLLSFIPLNRRKGHIRKANIPFWAVDWCSLPSFRVIMTFHDLSSRITDAKDDTRAQILVQNNGNELHIKGRRIGTLFKVTNSSSKLLNKTNGTATMEDAQKWLLECLDVYQGSEQPRLTLLQFLSSDSSDHFIKTLKWNGVVDEDHIDEWRQALLMIMDPFAAKWDPSAWENTCNALDKNGIGFARKRFARCSNGLVGWVDKDARADDCVCILYGGRFPFALRSTSSGRYRIICDCSISGLEQEKTDSEKQSKEEVFIICE